MQRKNKSPSIEPLKIRKREKSPQVEKPILPILPLLPKISVTKTQPKPIWSPIEQKVELDLNPEPAIEEETIKEKAEVLSPRLEAIVENVPQANTKLPSPPRKRYYRHDLNSEHSESSSDEVPLPEQPKEEKPT